MGAFLARIGVFLRAMAVRWWPIVLGWLGIQARRQAAKMALRAAILTVWGVLLAVVWTGLTGLFFGDVQAASELQSNPWSPWNAIANVMPLVCMVFPVHFATGLLGAYLTFRLTVTAAIGVANRIGLFLFGP